MHMPILGTWFIQKANRGHKNKKLLFFSRHKYSNKEDGHTQSKITMKMRSDGLR